MRKLRQLGELRRVLRRNGRLRRGRRVGVGACARVGIKKCDAGNPSQTACCVDDGKPNGACVPLYCKRNC